MSSNRCFNYCSKLRSMPTLSNKYQNSSHNDVKKKKHYLMKNLYVHICKLKTKVQRTDNQKKKIDQTNMTILSVIGVGTCVMGEENNIGETLN